MKRIALVILGCLATVAGMEIVLRGLPVATGMAYEPTSADSPVMRGKPNYDYVYSKGWNFRMVQHGRLNNFGYPAETDYTPGARSVLVIGDSYIEGLMLPPSARLQSQLEGLLGQSVPIYGLGRSGSELSQYLGVAHWGSTVFKPEAIVFNLVEHDVDNSLKKKIGDYNFDLRDGACRLDRSDRVAPAAIVQQASKSMVGGYFRRNLKLVEGIKSTVSALSPSVPVVASAEVDRSAEISQCFFRLVGDMTGLPKERLIFVIDGDSPAIYSGKPSKRRDIDSFADLAEAAGYPVIRMQAVFQRDYASARASYDFRPIDAHWNGHAHRLAAQAVAEKLSITRVADGSAAANGRQQ